MKRTFLSLATLGVLLAALLGGCGGGAPDVPPKIACLYLTDVAGAASYETLLDDNGYDATAVAVSATTAPADLMGYDLFVITDESTSYGSWTTYASTIDNECSKPVIGVGRCGSNYFRGILNAATMLPGLSGGGSGSPIETTVQVADSTDPIWTEPNVIDTSTEQVVIYTSGQTDYAAVYTTELNCFPVGSNGGISIGTEPTSSPTRHTLAKEGGRYFLWGYYGGPDAMTPDGQELFVNTVHYMLTTD